MIFAKIFIRRTITLCLCLCMAMAWMGAKPDGFSINKIDDALFARMKGKSYGAGCTVSREELRYLTVMHYDANGKVQKGELVCNKAIAQDLIEIFQALYEAKYPIERMVLIDEYDGDDEQSMRANNTSCFNFRKVAGTRSLSKHARGLAIDVNPFYNPYVHTIKGKQLIEPQGSSPWAINRDKKRNAMIIVGDDLCLKLFRQHGFTWGGNWRSMKDYQHFEKKIVSK
ncbi:MAG: M15 family metallopeptidase [Bacteroidaceae bacterium]|nr:M15 family metallopeptidase [Bacteroidaceae bacterium]